MISIASLAQDVAVHPDGQHLILPEGFARSAADSIILKRDTIRDGLRRIQMDAAGFYRCVPTGLLNELIAARWVILRLEKTAVNRYCRPFRVTAHSLVGSQPWTSFRANHPSAAVNSVPRIRVLSLHAPEIGTFTFDLDSLPEADRQRLFDVTLDRKVIVGHDLASDLSWLFGESTCRPSFLIDTALVARQVKPSLLLSPFGFAASGPAESRPYYAALLRKLKGRPSASLEYLGACLRLPASDRNESDFASWSVRPLSAEHHSRTTDCVELIRAIVQKIFPRIAIQDLPAQLNRWAPWYQAFAVASMRLAEAHLRGVPFDSEYAMQLKDEFSQELRNAVRELSEFSEFSDCLKEVANPDFGESSTLKEALMSHATKHGVVLPVTETRSIKIGSISVNSPGAHSAYGNLQGLPGLLLLQRIRRAKRSLKLLAEYNRSAKEDGRLHSDISFDTVTGRTTSTAPCLQNIPRDKKWRSLIRARPGYRILAVDYAAIELRIAAVLASRAIAHIRYKIRSREDESWFIKLCRAGASTDSPLTCPGEPETPTLEWWRAAIPAVAQRVLRDGIETMKSAFEAGLDLHLVTAIDMASRLDKINCGADALSWLRSKGETEREALLGALTDERQAAKACNFGLLYRMSAMGLYHTGVSNYGLKWSPEEAAQARLRWFDLFPEVRLWHFWTQYMQSRRVQSACLLWDRSTASLREPESLPKLYQTETLTGRPLSILNELRRALNYQDQATGADILARAVAYLPNDIAAMLLMPVHDELVFEVPAEQIQQIRSTVEGIMMTAAEEILNREVPVKVKTEVGDTWA